MSRRSLIVIMNTAQPQSRRDGSSFIFSTSLRLCGEVLFAASCLLLPLCAHAADKLTLAQAEQAAVQNHPRLRAAKYAAAAAEQAPKELSAAYMPNLQANFTGAEAPAGTRIAAGALNNPSIFGRYSNGVSGSQLITDFGRTNDYVHSARAHAAAENETAKFVRSDVLLQVDRTFYNALRAQAVLRVADEAVAARQTLADQVTALAKSKLKSELDVSFANVSLAQAKLAQSQAQNDVHAASAQLSEAMGYDDARDFQLVDEPGPDTAPPTLETMLKTGLVNRADVAAEQFQVQSAKDYAAAEHKLWMPSLSLVASAGMTPYGDPIFRDRYAASGFNLSVPVFNGFLFNARTTEAKLKQQAEQEKFAGLRNRAMRDLRLAWLQADTAYRRLGLTSQLLAEASQALELAQTRYQLGLSSIVEVSQAQLNETEAETEQASAKYDYRAQMSNLKYQAGLLQ